VVLDTYARNAVGGDENSAKDVGVAIRQIDHLRFSLHTAVVVVHHIGKKGTSERGSGALRGAADEMLLLTGKPAALSLSVDKMKNFEAAKPVALHLERVGDSLVPTEASSAASMWVAAASGDHVDGGEDRDLRDKIVAVLKSSKEEGRPTLSQSELGRRVGGNATHRNEVLRWMAAQEDCPVTLEKKRNTYLYSLSTNADSIPPTP